MEELYKVIEEKIKKSGCPIEINGQDFYNDVSDEVDEKENGTYLAMLQKDEDTIYEMCIEIMENEFDLHYADIRYKGEVYHVDFDS